MSRVFPIIPASSKTLWFLGSLAIFIAVLMLGLICLFGYIAYSSGHSQFELSGEGLHIQGDLYGRKISIASLVINEAKQITLNDSPEYQPKWRLNGTALPGYRSGWFKLYNGEKALLFVTDPMKVVYLPTREGYSVLISVINPEEFLQFLHEVSL